MLPFALLSLPALLLTRVFDRKRLDERQANPTLSLALRLAPFYLWLGILSAQPHKEERFMYPIYPMIAFNGAVTIYLVRGWFEAAFIAITSSPYQVRSMCLVRASHILNFARSSP